MSDDLLKALGGVGREEREASERLAGEAPPLDDLARERMVAAALAESKAQPHEAPPTRTKGRGGRIAMVVGLVAAAALLFLFLGRRGEMLPAYELAVQGGTSEWRGEEQTAAGRVVVRADGTIELLLRPSAPVTRPLDGRAFATRGVTTRSLPVEMSAQGVLRVVGNAGEMFGAPERGREETWDVLLVVGEKGQVPAAAADARARTDLRRSTLTVVVTN